MPDTNTVEFTTPAKKSRARKTSDKPTRIYSYRILPPTDPEQRKLVEDQFWLAHQYRGRLTEIEIALREQFRLIDLDHPRTREACFIWEAQSNTLDDLYAQLRAGKSGTAPANRDVEHIVAQIAEWKRECARAWTGVKEARASAEVQAHHQPRYVAAREAASAARRAARGEFSAKGLMHGTYIRIEQAVERSVDSTGRPPMFERYTGEGSIGHQLPRRRDSAGKLYSVLAKDLYINPARAVDARDNAERALAEPAPAVEHAVGPDEPAPVVDVGDDHAHAARPRVLPFRMTELPDGWEALPRTARRRVAKPYRELAKRQKHGDGWQEIPARHDGQYIEMQFGWRPAGRPSTWIRFPLTHHRRMPADAEILWVHVHRWRVGIHYEWRVQLTIESDTFRRPEAPVAHGGTCAIDIGWRQIFGADGAQIGLRVGYLVDEHGRELEIRAPDGLWQRLAKVYSLAQIRSRELDGIRDRLVTWCAGRTMPTWFEDRANGLAQWRAPRKMQRLADTWKTTTERIDGDAEMLASLLAWAKQDRHLASWEAHMRDRTIAHRREIWRCVAANIARTYETIVVEDGMCRSDGREGQMKIVDIDGWNRPLPEDGDPHEGREQRRQSRMAAPGELRLAIAHAAHKTASTLIDVARTKNSTRECAWCGHVQKHANFAATIQIQCEDCHRAWDQDANAARNLLHRRGLSSGPMPAPRPDASDAVATPAPRPLAARNSKPRRESRDAARKYVARGTAG